MKDITPTSIRMEKDIMDRIRSDAKRDKRSVTAQIEFMIEKYYEIVDSVTSPISRIEKDTQNAG